MARQNRRRKKLVRLDLQLKVVFITLFVASLVLLINFQLSLAGLWSLKNELGTRPELAKMIRALEASTIQKFLLSVAMAVPLAGFVGVLYSFKFCGPIYKFKKYFLGLKASRWDERCMLRKGDDLQDVCDAINEGFGLVRDHVRDTHALCADMSRFLDDAVFTVDGQTQALLERVREGLEAERAVYARHFDISCESTKAVAQDCESAATDPAEAAAPENREVEAQA